VNSEHLNLDNYLPLKMLFRTYRVQAYCFSNCRSVNDCVMLVL